MDRDSAPLREDPVITVLVTATSSPSAPPFNTITLTNTVTLTITVTDINDNPPICTPDAQRSYFYIVVYLFFQYCIQQIDS
jgi:hypothetical protein